jgi:hypothetical protein
MALLATLAGVATASAEEDDGLRPDPELTQHARTLLNEGDYGFCTGSKYRFWREDKERICPRVAEFEAACPATRAACQRKAWDEETPEDISRWGAWFEKLVAVIGPIAHVLFWGLLGLAILFLGRWLYGKRLGLQRRATTQPLPNAPAPASAREEDPLTTKQLLELGRTLLARGQTRGALLVFYRATIRALSDARLVVPQRSKTRLEYLDELARLEHFADPEVATLTSELEAQAYGAAAPSDSLAAELGGRAERLAQKLGRLAPLVALLTCLGCTGDAVPQLPTAPTAPRGHALFETLLKERALKVERRVRDLSSIDEDVGVIIAFSPTLRPREWEVLKRWVRGGGHLVMTGRDKGFEAAFALDGTTRSCSEKIELAPLRIVALDPVEALERPADADTWLRCGKNSVVATVALGDGWLTWATSDLWFQNRSLALGDNVTWVMAAMAADGSAVELLGNWTGQGAHHPLESLWRAGLGPWVLQLLVLLALYAWARGRRFGSPRDPEEDRRRAFAEHATALSTQYARAGASAFVLSRYAEWAFEVLRRRLPTAEGDARSLGRALGEDGEARRDLARNLTLSRKADELGEDEARHLARFQRLDDAVRRTNGR